MRKILLFGLVCFELAIANSNTCLAQDKVHEKTSDEMVCRLTQAEKKGQNCASNLKGRHDEVGPAIWCLCEVILAFKRFCHR